MSTSLEPQDPKIVHVAVGVIMQSDQVLICWRDAKLHQGNRYEFPGGKVEAGETPRQALARELLEELNIQVKTVVRAQQLYFNYPEKTVCLHIFKVTAFSGAPCGQQNQAIRWVNKYELGQYQFPDANAPILRMVLLPDEYVITKPQSNTQDLDKWLNWHIHHTPQQAWLYVRHKQLDTSQYQQVITTLARQRPDLQLFAMYSHIKALKSCWPECKIFLAGVHFSQAELMQLSVHTEPTELPSSWYRVAACHDQASITQANALGLDAVLLSPLHTTSTHAGQAGLGWKEWQQLCKNSMLPVYALGGVAPNDLAQVQQADGFGVAGIRAFYSSVCNS
ncbi:MAG: Nudix family hydrolase [Moraxellaceae bacterium]|nr:MAG: Nudix family hydrolase [Moraxellaceae bacterium]